ncbi:unnamed protein product [Moneuplotes crassus]|uniref:Uncharacterized protein n=1 Tax=Euplotes crassus TaxID=5936 RepID=A0AAD1U085_EUPCR|nr:unnamed protein product [Moneuplotes crassus]
MQTVHQPVEIESRLKQACGPNCQFQNRLGILETDLMKSRAECIKLKKEIASLQKVISVDGRSTNDTSSTALLPSEFKELWKELTTEKIIDAFANFYDDQHLYILLIQTTFNICQLEIKNLIQRKKDEIIGVLSISQEEDKRSVSTRIEKVFQIYSRYIFKYDKTFCTEISNKLLETLKTKFKTSLPAEEFCKLFEDGDASTPSPDLEEMMECEEFEGCIKILHTLCLNMILSDPPITIELMEFVNLENDKQVHDLEEIFSSLITSMSYDKTQHECMDGFPSENKPCLLVLNPPKKQNSNFVGIKKSVVMVDKQYEKFVTPQKANDTKLATQESTTSNELETPFKATEEDHLVEEIDISPIDVSVKNIAKTVERPLKNPSRGIEYYDPSYETKDTHVFDDTEIKKNLIRHKFDNIPNFSSVNKRSSYCSTNKATDYKFYNPIGTEKNSHRKYNKNQTKRAREEFKYKKTESQRPSTSRLSEKSQPSKAHKRGKGSIVVTRAENTFYNEISHSYWNYLKEKGRAECSNRNSIESQNYICSNKAFKTLKEKKPKKKKRDSCTKKVSVIRRKISKTKTAKMTENKYKRFVSRNGMKNPNERYGQGTQPSLKENNSTKFLEPQKTISNSQSKSKLKYLPLKSRTYEISGTCPGKVLRKSKKTNLYK